MHHLLIRCLDIQLDIYWLSVGLNDLLQIIGHGNVVGMFPDVKHNLVAFLERGAPPSINLEFKAVGYLCQSNGAIHAVKVRDDPHQSRKRFGRYFD